MGTCPDPNRPFFPPTPVSETSVHLSLRSVGKKTQNKRLMWHRERHQATKAVLRGCWRQWVCLITPTTVGGVGLQLTLLTDLIPDQSAHNCPGATPRNPSWINTLGASHAHPSTAPSVGCKVHRSQGQPPRSKDTLAPTFCCWCDPFHCSHRCARVLG